MTHRVYLRWPPQKVSDATTTESEAVARFAYDELLRRSDLQDQSVAVAWTCDGKQLAFHNFQTPPPAAGREP